eukprot:SAG22_NODE_14869_length_362_cov_73.144487_1_plen_72_part_01
MLNGWRGCHRRVRSREAGAYSNRHTVQAAKRAGVWGASKYGTVKNTGGSALCAECAQMQQTPMLPMTVQPIT